MKLILRNSTNPYFNIAAEEHFLKNYDDDIIMFWQSSPSVIVGKHQNAMAEVNINFTTKNNIPIIRRISGGGTVYHDDGNINYTIITSSENREKLVDFVNFTKPIIGFLKTLGLNAVYGGKNNLSINGKKFSGNSAHVFKNRILNHGTLLFNTNISNLESSIESGDFNITDKSVKSIRAYVGNISDHLEHSISIDVFFEKLVQYFRGYFKIKSTTKISDNDVIKINELADNKYKLWEWNYGYSPSFNYSFKNKGNELSMDIKKGEITKISLTCNQLYDSKICDNLINMNYKQEDIEVILKKLNMTPEEVSSYKILFRGTR